MQEAAETVASFWEKTTVKDTATEDDCEPPKTDHWRVSKRKEELTYKKPATKK
jgi:hypothetical protein